MKLSGTFLAGLASLTFVTAGPTVPTNLAPKPAWALPRLELAHGTRLIWSPPGAHEHQPQMRANWEARCGLALANAGCGVGIIYEGRKTWKKRNGDTATYVNVQGAESLAHYLENSRKMRVFADGSTRDGWFQRDEEPKPKAEQQKSPEKLTKKRKKDLQWWDAQSLSPEGNDAANPRILWDPADAYLNYPKKRKLWEERCGKALTREECSAGIIHKGETGWTTPEGIPTSYIKVGALPVRNPKDLKRLRVFQDGSSETGWSEQDRQALAKAKWTWRGQQTSKAEPHKALLSWDPKDSYQNQRHRRLFWEKRCDEALTREGCTIGVMHRGENRWTKTNGEKTYYITVEGAVSKADMDHEHAKKKMRVFEDGTFQVPEEWSERERVAIVKGKRLRYPDRSMEYTRLGGPVEAKTSIQAPSQEHTKAHFTPSITWDPPQAYLPGNALLRQGYERACHEALIREGCKFGIIHQGYHVASINPDGTRTYYMNVSAGKHGDPRSMDYMRLYENGQSRWYAPGRPLPRKDYRRKKDAILSTAQLSAKYKRPPGRPITKSKNRR